MARRINNELVLDHDESLDFSFRMAHPDIDAIAARDLFLQELDNIQLSFNNGEIIAVLPDITIPTIDSCLYDSEPLQTHVFKIAYDSKNDAHPFRERAFAEQCDYSATKNEEWATGFMSSILLPEAA